MNTRLKKPCVLYPWGLYHKALNHKLIKVVSNLLTRHISFMVFAFHVYHFQMLRVT